MNEAFQRLSPRMRHGLVHTLGWRDLRPVQEETIQYVLDGFNAIVLAPTAGGKTEAAALPVLDSLAATPLKGVGAIYLSPLRALLNNLEARLQRLAGIVGMRVLKWHGDVGAAEKRTLGEDPAELLMITPESLEGLLAGARHDKRGLFPDLRFLIVDEIHAFAGDDRGAHLMAVVERLTDYAARDFQRLGLSATVGDPQTLLEWLTGSSLREGRIVRPPAEQTTRRIEIHPLGEDEDPASRARALVAGKKSLVFAESRGRAENLKAGLEGGRLRVFIHHGSLSRDLREESEAAFRSGSNCCIVCTSTMELGLDVGDLDLVVQMDAPPTVSAFLQRLGRSGRRADRTGHLAFVTDSVWTFLQAVALVSLASQRRVEPVEPSSRAADIFVQQILARILQEHGLPRHALVRGVGRPFPFRDLSPSEREGIVDHLLGSGILIEVDDVLTFGPRSDELFAANNYRDLYTVIQAAEELQVKTTSNKAVGRIESWFARSMAQRDFVFLLGGRAWRTVECDWRRGVVVVAPAPRGTVPRWHGGLRLLSQSVSEEMRSWLVRRDGPSFLGSAAARVLAGLQDRWRPILDSGRLALVRRDEHWVLYTFAGGRINQTLGNLLEARLGVSVPIDNFWLRIPLMDASRLRHALQQEMKAGDLVRRLRPARVSKFQDLLPPSLKTELIARHLLDIEGARRLVEEKISIVDAPGDGW